MMISQQELTRSVQNLYDACKTGEKDLHAASEQMQNRGPKLLLKRFAQEHRILANRLAKLAATSGFKLSTLGRFGDSIQRGWMDLRVAMIVGRADRQTAAVSEAVQREGELTRVYDDVLDMPLPESARNELQYQRGVIHRIYRWLQRVVDEERWIIRLYDATDKATQAVEELAHSGFSESQIKVTPLHEIVVYPEDAAERDRSMIDAVLVGTLLGAASGIPFGILTGYVTAVLLPSMQSLSLGLFASLMLWGLVWALLGALGGGFFGLLVGRALAEDDAALVATMQHPGTTIVSVETTKQNRTDAAEILNIRHQREVERDSGEGPRLGHASVDNGSNKPYHGGYDSDVLGDRVMALRLFVLRG